MGMNVLTLEIIVIILPVLALIGFTKRRRFLSSLRSVQEDLDYYIQPAVLDADLKDLYDHAYRLVDKIIQSQLSQSKKEYFLRRLHDYMTFSVVYRIRAFRDISELYRAIWIFRLNKAKGFRHQDNPRQKAVSIAIGHESTLVFSDVRMHFAEALGISIREVTKLFNGWFSPFSGKVFERNPMFLTSLYWVERELTALGLQRADQMKIFSAALQEMRHTISTLKANDFSPFIADWDW